jgi:hypothetical protein
LSDRWVDIPAAGPILGEEVRSAVAAAETTEEGAVGPHLAAALVQSTAEEAAPSAWVWGPMIIGMLLLFVLFGWGIWRMASPANWAQPCPSCLRQGGHSKRCPDRPPGPDGLSWGERVAEVGFFALLNALFQGDD